MHFEDSMSDKASESAVAAAVCLSIFHVVMKGGQRTSAKDEVFETKSEEEGKTNEVIESISFLFC